MRPLGRAVPVAGGIDLDLPGDGVRLRATRWPGAGPPVLLLHGLASQRRFWNLVVPTLAGLPLLAIDQRGHGDSQRPAAGYDTATVVRDAATALDAIGVSRAVVVGHSWGAMVALAFAAAHPERTLATVAIDGGMRPPGGAAAREETRRRMEPPRWSAPPDDVAAVLRAGPLSPYWSDGVAQAVLANFGVGADGQARARLPFEAHMLIVDALLDYDAETTLTAVRCPAWLVSCEPVPADGWAARKAASLDRAAELLSRPRLLRWSGALHDVPLQWPALVGGLVRAAVDEVGQPESTTTMGAE